jgi:hypothetical protein
MLSGQFAKQFRQHVSPPTAEMKKFQSDPAGYANGLHLANGPERRRTGLNQNLGSDTAFERRTGFNAAPIQAQITKPARQLHAFGGQANDLRQPGTAEARTAAALGSVQQ